MSSTFTAAMPTGAAPQPREPPGILVPLAAHALATDRPRELRTGAACDAAGGARRTQAPRREAGPRRGGDALVSTRRRPSARAGGGRAAVGGNRLWRTRRPSAAGVPRSYRPLRARRRGGRAARFVSGRTSPSSELDPARSATPRARTLGLYPVARRLAAQLRSYGGASSRTGLAWWTRRLFGRTGRASRGSRPDLDDAFRSAALAAELAATATADSRRPSFDEPVGSRRRLRPPP